MKKKTGTVKISLKDQLIRTPIENMLPGNIMFTQPESMIITKIGECWLIPYESVISFPNPIENMIMGLIKDIDNKYIVFCRNLNFFWEPIRKPSIKLLPIKEIRDVASEVIEIQQQYDETYYSSRNEEDNDDFMST